MLRLICCVGLSFIGLAAPARSHGQDLLAEALPNATLSVKDVKGVWLPLKKGEIFRLTTGRLVFLAKNANATEVIDKPDVLTAEVIVSDAKHEWKWTRETKMFEGSKPVPVVLPNVTPAKATPADEARYQYFLACRLWDRLEAALQFGDDAAVESIRKRASAMVSHTRSNTLTPDTTPLFEDLISDIQDFKRAAARRRELWKEFQDEAARLDEEARARAAQAANEQMAGLMKLFVGGFTASSTDRYYSPSDNTIYSVTTVNEGSVRLAGEGLTDMMAAGARQSRNQSYFNSLKSSLKSDIARKLEAVDAEQVAAWESRRTKTESFARRHFNIEPVGGVPDGKSLVRLMIDRKDRQTLQKIVAEQVKNERGSTSRDNPFRLADLYDCETRTPSLSPETVIARLSERSRDLVAAARLAPAARAYDLDRASLLLQAASMANTAARLENPNRSLAGSVSVNALFAGHCVALVESYNLLDIDGQIRKQKVLAFARSGRVAEAAEQLAGLGDQLADDADHQITAAQVYAAVRKPDQAATALGAAMKAGYSNIPAIRANPNFQTALTNKSFKALLQVETASAVRLEAMNGFGGARTPDPKRNTLTVTNESAFPLTNVKIQLEVYSGNAATPVSRKNLAIDRINPGQTVVLIGAATPPAASAFATPKVASKMALTCDQVPANTPVRQNPTTEFK